MPSPFDLTGKVALVTGAYRGLGFAVAQGLARAGAIVVVNGRRHDVVDAAAQKLREQGLKASSAVFDVTQREAVRRGVADIEGSLGSVDILFNNAGIQRRGAFVEFPQEQWDEIMATNLTAPFIVSQAVLPAMIGKKRGKIVHIASLMSELARPTVVPYTTAKGGVRQLTRGMAVELAPYNIQVNAIAPGWFVTDMNAAAFDEPKVRERLLRDVPARRTGRVEEIGPLVVYLASRASDYMTGQTVHLDGGHSAA